MSGETTSAAVPVVIVGSGLAGYAVAREFRKLDKETPLVVLSRDHGGFYSKPMLSNALAGQKTAASLLMKPADKMAAELNASVRVGVSVQRIATAERELTLSGGEVLAYRDLVLALGADPIRLPLEGDAANTVLSVNDLDDYARFAQALEGARSVAILGGGLIGCEFANDLLHRGIAPTVLDVADRPLSRLLPVEASAWLRAWLEAAGVNFRFGVTASRIDHADDGGVKLALSDGSTLHTDRVLSAIGLRPRVSIAEAAGLAVGRGITTDRLLATSAAHLYAVGDCAEVMGLNLPYVMPLMQQSRALAATLCGHPTPVGYPAMPVLVKTPACPTVVCPPPPDAVGRWTVISTEDACEARYIDACGVLAGFALLGAATSQKQALAATVPAWLAD
ncbi:MAG: FAD-dependent oxidoreductase [Pseudomonadota bacterium]|nr:FAD-dependent oxidoreductase [Pseudomonadota bacterium]